MKIRTRITHPFAATVMAALLALLAGLALSQDMGGEVTVDMAENEQYGQILTDAEGRSLYLFRNNEAESTDPERMTEGVRSNAAPCTNGCLENWPPVTAESAVAGEGLDQELLYVTDVDGRMQVVYNGWPLYYFANDAEPGQAMGQGLGGGGNTWHLLNTQGMAVEGADGAMDGAMDGDGATTDDATTDDTTTDDATTDDAAADDTTTDDTTTDDATTDDTTDGDATDGDATDGDTD